MNAESNGAHVEILRTELNRRKAKNPAYSLRAFAKYLSLDAAAVSRILNGKQDLSLKCAASVAQKLNLESAELEKFLVSVASQKLKKAYSRLGAEAVVPSGTDRLLAIAAATTVALHFNGQL